MIVVDASALGAFLIPDEAGPFADFARAACETQPMHVPAHFSVEVANLIRKARWRKRLTDAQMASAAAVAHAIAASVSVARALSVERLVTESASLGLSAYETGYFLLARSLRAPLLTDDGSLRRVAIARNLDVLLP